MAKGLCNIPNEYDRIQIMNRRLKNNAGGLGTLAAEDMQKRIFEKIEADKKKAGKDGK